MKERWGFEQRIVGKKPVKAQIAAPNNFMFFLLPNYVFYLNFFFWLITKIKWNSKHFLRLYTSHLFKRKKKRFKKVDLVYTWKVFTWAFHVEEKTCILFERKRKQCMQVINKLLGSPLKITSTFDPELNLKRYAWRSQLQECASQSDRDVAHNLLTRTRNWSINI